MSMNDSFEISKGNGWNIVYRSHAERYSLYGPNGLSLSSQHYSECAARASEKGAVLDPVPFVVGKTPEGKDVSVKSKKDGSLELDYGTTPTLEFSDVGECVRMAIVRTKPVPRKAFVPQK
jgi:hypothetical protein